MKTRPLAAAALALTLTISAAPAFAASVEFTDVPSSHWAYSSVMEMAERGVVSGVGNNHYAPDNTISYAEFATMITRSFFNDQISGGDGSTWYSDFMATAEKVGALAGTKVASDASIAEGSINRYDMAQVMYNVMVQKGVSAPSDFDNSKIADWASIPANYQSAVSACYSLGALSGTDANGTFSGTSVMTRAQAAVVMDRLLELCEAPTAPEKPSEVPADAVQVTGDSSIITKLTNTTPTGDGFKLEADGFTNKYAGISIETGGKYSTLVFTVTSGSMKNYAFCSSMDGFFGTALISAEDHSYTIQPGESRTYTVDISGVNKIDFGARNGRSADCTITNIYIW